MAKVGKAAARSEVNYIEDEIWKIVVNTEERRVREWNKTYDFLVSPEKKAILKEVEKPIEKRREKRIEPFQSELILIPTPPQRNCPEVEDRIYFRQPKDRPLRMSKMQQYYHNVSIPPQHLDPTKAAMQKTRMNSKNLKVRQTEMSEFDKHTASRKGLENIAVADEDDEDKKQEEKKSNEPLNVSKQLLGIVDSPRTRFGRKVLTSHDYGWERPSLEFFGVAKHGYKKFKLE